MAATLTDRSLRSGIGHRVTTAWIGPAGARPKPGPARSMPGPAWLQAGGSHEAPMSMLPSKDSFEAATQLFALVSDMAAERDRMRLAAKCLEAACRISGARGGVLYALDQTGRQLVPVAALPPQLGVSPAGIVPLYRNGRPDMTDPRSWCAFAGSVAVIEDVARVHGFDSGAIERRSGSSGTPTRSLLACPLRGNDDVTVGVLELINLVDSDGSGSGRQAMDLLVPLIRAFAYQAAIIIANTALLDQNRRLVKELDAVNGDLRRENQRLKHERITVASRATGLVTRSPLMERVLDMVDKVAETDVPVLILGETGTGKDVVARLLHMAGPRRDGPFVAQNCAALPAELLESELFGYRKGAFTGAQADKKGLFQAADGGTLFLDEIGDMPMGLQTKLLRVLQDGEVRALGATEGQRSDARIVCATNVDLRARVAEGRFREDLFYRISVFPIELPPLRRRDGDIALLAEHFLAEMPEAQLKEIRGILPEAQAVLDRHPFPGNVRELRNAIARAVILCRPGEAIGVDDLPPALLAAGGQDPAAVLPPAAEEDRSGLRDTIRRYEAGAIVEALKASGGNRTHAAMALGLSRRALQEKIARYGLGRGVAGRPAG